MDNWKYVPHLFANGKFKIFHPMRKEREDFNAYSFNELECYIDECTLIARKIDDITDKELSNLSWRLNADYTKKEKATTVHDFIQLLSIGVYPFDQSQF